jgi:hypothetical protein
MIVFEFITPIEIQNFIIWISKMKLKIIIIFKN